MANTIDANSKRTTSQKPTAATTVMADNQLFDSNIDDLWVFGYGSLIWKTGFEYDEERHGYIEGYSRRFWQGNTTHRGKPNKPGRVATLIEDKNGLVWGKAFHVTGQERVQAALTHLGARECRLGGYSCIKLTFICDHSNTAPSRDDTRDADRLNNNYNNVAVTSSRRRRAPERIEGTFTFVATPDNHLYLGDAPMEQIACEVTTSCGFAGHNVEYVTRLADYTREHLPREHDAHLFQLDSLIRSYLLQRQKCLHCLIINCILSGGPDKVDSELYANQVDCNVSFTFPAIAPELSMIPVSKPCSHRSRPPTPEVTDPLPQPHDLPLSSPHHHQQDDPSVMTSRPYICCSDCHYEAFVINSKPGERSNSFGV